MRVDVHTHFLPKPFRDLLENWEKDVRIEVRDGESVVVHTAGSFRLSPGFRDLDARIEWMADHDVDHGLMSVSTPFPTAGPFSSEESEELVRAINDGFDAAARTYPDAVSGLGSLPLRDPEAALAELDRIRDLKLAGVALPTTVRGEKLSIPALEPVFDRLDSLGLCAFIHPTRNALSRGFAPEEWIHNPMTVFPTETTVQVGRLIFDGFFDRHDFDVVLSHMGGAIPYLAGRFAHVGDRYRSDSGVFPERPISEYIERFYYDTISFHPPAVETALETVGADHLVFGTDYPFGMENTNETVENIDRLDLPESTHRAVMGETAAELFDF